MTDQLTRVPFGTVVRTATGADGILTFEASRATGGGTRHFDGLTVDAEWARTAMQEWFDTGANLREQHDMLRAVGVATSLEHRADGEYVAGKVVDPVTALKAREGVLKFLSVGVHNPTIDRAVDPQGVLKGGKIVEVTLCDRGADPHTRLVLGRAAGDGTFEPGRVETLPEGDLGRAAKEMPREHTHGHDHRGGSHRHAHAHGDEGYDHDAEDDVTHRHDHDAEDPKLRRAAAPALTRAPTDPDERARLAKEGKALPDGSFPIPNVVFLKKAIRAVGRAKDRAKAVAFIKKRARELGQPKLAANLHAAAIAALTRAMDDDAHHDPAELACIRQSLADCLTQEIQELVDGEDELGDIQQLTDCLGLFMAWWSHEAWEGEVAAPSEPAAPMAAAATPDLIRALAAPEIVDALRTALAPAIQQATEAAVKPVADGLAEVRQMAVPGGPAKARPPGAADLQAQRTLHETEADRLLRLAAATTDRDLAQGYRVLAAEHQAQLATPPAA